MKQILILAFTFFTATTFALSPKAEYDITPADYGLNVEEHFIKTDDGVNLFAWKYIPEGSASKTVIMAHNGEGNISDYIEQAAQFMSAGYNVWAFDYRGYGKSDDFNVNEKFYIYAQFAQDLEAVLNHVKKYEAKQQVTLYGFGIGGAMAIGVGCNSHKVTKVIADSPYSNLEDMKKNLKDGTGKDYLMPLGYDKAIMEPQYALESCDKLESILLIVGDQDPVVTEDDVKELSKISKKNTEMHIVEGVTNDETFTSDKNAYFEAIRDFLE